MQGAKGKSLAKPAKIFETLVGLCPPYVSNIFKSIKMSKLMKYCD